MARPRPNITGPYTRRDVPELGTRRTETDPVLEAYWHVDRWLTRITPWVLLACGLFWLVAVLLWALR